MILHGNHRHDFRLGNFFIFNGINSLSFRTLIVNELPPIVRATERVDQYTIEGRHGKLNVHTGVYDTTIKNIQCTLRNLDEVDKIIDWLRGTGTITFSNQPDRYYKCSIINQIPFERVISQFRSFIVELECHPVAISIDNDFPITMNKPGKLMGQGNIDSNPIITVYGQGNGVLTINGTRIELIGIDGYLTINCETIQCYKDKTSQGRKMKGVYPTLSYKENDITWSGGINKLEILPKWSWN